jgi:hypothetical protein
LRYKNVRSLREAIKLRSLERKYTDFLVCR